MDPTLDLLARARAIEVARTAERRRKDAVLARCRRRILGIFARDVPCPRASA